MAATKNGTIGERVAAVRAAAGLSQREVLRVTGINVWRVENDRFTPNVETLRRIAEACGADVRDLLG